MLFDIKNIKHNLFVFALIAVLATFPIETTYVFPQSIVTEWVLQESVSKRCSKTYVVHFSVIKPLSNFWLSNAESYLINYNHSVLIDTINLSKKRLSIKASETLNLVLLPNFPKEDIS